MNKKWMLRSIVYIIVVFSVTAQSHKIDNDSIKINGSNVLNYVVKNINGEDVNLKEYEGKVLLIVNVASKCGYTPQYEGLEKIYKKYKPKGFEILAFPCNDFKQQEPGTNEEIQNFCSINYGVTFQLFDKISVKGNSKAPLYKMLTDNLVTGKSEINWNFEKFIIDKNGNVVKHFRSKTTPESRELTSVIEELLVK